MVNISRQSSLSAKGHGYLLGMGFVDTVMGESGADMLDSSEEYDEVARSTVSVTGDSAG